MTAVFVLSIKCSQQSSGYDMTRCCFDSTNAMQICMIKNLLALQVNKGEMFVCTVDGIFKTGADQKTVRLHVIMIKFTYKTENTGN